MARCLVLVLVSLAAAGCATQPFVSAPCNVDGSVPSVIQEVETFQAKPDCGPLSAEYRSASTIGSVSQTGGQTRTVGVPRAFFVTMLILILLVGVN